MQHRNACTRAAHQSGRVSGYPRSSTSIFISKKKYFIEILYSISISSVPILSLSHTLYSLFHILFTFLALSAQCLECVPAGRYARVRDTGVRTRARYAA
jgi:hypothetical protein